ncbi:MAG: hypothetical protein CBB68_00800 [Rhodospirillaceae bacterium TMED8]|nr:MAG: hypothetical protein CBB68_00800 [Rhodospirillaceae bacterium TMED8]
MLSSRTRSLVYLLELMTGIVESVKMIGTQIATDQVVPFQLGSLGVRGRVVRLNDATSTLTTNSRYPKAVSYLLSETMALTALFASALKYKGMFSTQIRGSGPINLLIANATSEGELRAYAKYDESILSKKLTKQEGLFPNLIGSGHMAFTVDQGPGTERYQGITELSGTSLSDSATSYFRDSEQLETAIISALADTKSDTKRKQAVVAVMMIQRLPIEGIEINDAEDAWREATLLLNTITPNELLNLSISEEQLLTNTYHECDVTIFSPKSQKFACRCSRERVSRTLSSFSREEIESMKVDGVVTVTCEFCKNDYSFSSVDLDLIFG